MGQCGLEFKGTISVLKWANFELRTQTRRCGLLSAQMLTGRTTELVVSLKKEKLKWQSEKKRMRDK
jgi:hypothetical protein